MARLPLGRSSTLGMVLDKIALRAARACMIREGERVGIAVSGGADSVALLHALALLYPRHELVVLHLNHCLRGHESDGDAEFVRELASGLGRRAFVRREDVAAVAGEAGDNLEQAGRRCRYRFFCELLARGVCEKVATAHTRSDQAETVLLRLLRGAAGAGLSGVRPVYRERIVRPMLDVSRGEVIAFLKSRNIRWREDRSNEDLGFARNRLRHALLPDLRRDWNPNVEEALARTADWAAEEEHFWRRRTAVLWRRCVWEESDGVVLDTRAARRLLPAEQRRLLHEILRRRLASAKAPGFQHIEKLRALIGAEAGTGAVDLPGARAERSFEGILFRPRRGHVAAEYNLPLAVPGSISVPGQAGFVLRARLFSGAGGYNAWGSALLDWDRVPKPLHLRNWRPGDRYRPARHETPRRLKDLFQRRRISSWRRAAWPVVASSGAGTERILWAREFGAAAEFAAGPGSAAVLALDEQRGPDRAKVP